MDFVIAIYYQIMNCPQNLTGLKQAFLWLHAYEIQRYLVWLLLPHSLSKDCSRSLAGAAILSEGSIERQASSQLPPVVVSVIQFPPRLLTEGLGSLLTVTLVVGGGHPQFPAMGASA